MICLMMSAHQDDPARLQIFNSSKLKLPFDKKKLLQLLESVEKNESVSFHMLELVYVDEADIVNINKKYLNHDNVTDIITFRYDEDKSVHNIEGTLYCCAPRIVEQSAEYTTDLHQEFYRIFIHGLLHLAGYDDKTETDKKRMTELEDYYLANETQQK